MQPISLIDIFIYIQWYMYRGAKRVPSPPSLVNIIFTETIIFFSILFYNLG